MSAERAALAAIQAIEAIARSALYVETRAAHERQVVAPFPPPIEGVGSEIAPHSLLSKSAGARVAAAFGELAEAVESAITEATKR